MQILILNWKDVKNPAKGGAEVIAFEFAKRLVKDGHSVTFFSRTFENASEEEEIDGVKIIRRGNPITVYLHAYLYYVGLHKKPDKVIDMVNTICWQTSLYAPQKNRVMYVNQLAKEVLFYELPWPISWFAYLLEKVEYFSYKETKVLCYSKSTKDDLIAFGIPSSHINIFPLGLDHNRYVPSKKKSKAPLFLFVARLVKMKRAALCIEAMELLVRKYSNAKLAIIGNGPEEVRLENLVGEKKLKNNILFLNKDNFFLSKTNKDRKLTYMQEAWCLLLPSVKEGWGMVVTEAAACGTPAIVSNVTGLRDSVVDNKTGIIVSSEPTPRELADAMEKMLDHGVREKFSKNAIQWAKNFNWEKSYKEFKKQILS